MSSQRLVRLKAEMGMMSKNPVPGIHCWLKEANSDVIMVEMEGPDGSPYQAGVFQLEVVLSDRYPFTPPNVRFVTPVYHPNIDPQGRICLTALKPKPTGTWAVNLNIATVLGAIRILLAEPNLSDPLMSDIAKQYTENYQAYRNQAQAETAKYAKKLPSFKESSSSEKHPASSKVPGKSTATGKKEQFEDTIDSKENKLLKSGKIKEQSSSTVDSSYEKNPKKPRLS